MYRDTWNFDDKTDEQKHKSPPLNRFTAFSKDTPTELFGVLAQLLERQDIERVLLGIWVLFETGHPGSPSLRLTGIGDDMTSYQLIVAKLAKIAIEIQHQNRDQHQHAAKHRVEEKLDRRIFPPRTSPDTDQKIHRKEHHFPEDKKQEKVECQENSQHSCLQNQEQDTVGFDMLFDRPTGTHREHADKGCENKQRETDSVHSHVVLNIKYRNPIHLKYVLHLRNRISGEREMRPPTDPRQCHHHCGTKHNDGNEQAHPFDCFGILAGQQQKNQRAYRR